MPDNGSGKKNFKALIVSVCALVIVCLLAVGLFFTLQKKQRENEERVLREMREAEQEKKAIAERTEREEKERIRAEHGKKWNDAVRMKEETLKKGAGFDEAIAGLEKIRAEMAGTEYAGKADAEIAALENAKKSAAAKVLGDITRQAEEAAAAGDLEKATEILRGYSGVFAGETRNEREAAAGKYSEKARDAADRKRKLEDDKNALLKTVAVCLMKGAHVEAAAGVEDARGRIPDAGFIDEINGVVASLSGMDKLVFESLAADVGKDVEIRSEGKTQSVKISRVKDGAVYIKKPFGSALIEAKISMADLSSAEKIRRAVKAGGKAAAAYAAAVDAGEGNYEKAEQSANSAGMLREFLLSQIRELKEKAAEKKASAERPAASPAVKDDAANKIATNPQNIAIEADVKVEKKENPVEGGEHNKIELIKMKLKIKNNSILEFRDRKADVYIIGESAAESHVCSIIDSFTRDLSIKNTDSQEFEFEAQSEFNKMGVMKYGFEYFGYLVLIKDRNDTVFTVKSNKPALAKMADKIRKKGAHDEFDARTGDEVKVSAKGK